MLQTTPNIENMVCKLSFAGKKHIKGKRNNVRFQETKSWWDEDIIEWTSKKAYPNKRKASMIIHSNSEILI